jgi:hypothetical protein
MSSFTTEAGLWITSPAAIWLATESGKSFIISAIEPNLVLFFAKLYALQAGTMPGGLPVCKET